MKKLKMSKLEVPKYFVKFPEIVERILLRNLRNQYKNFSGNLKYIFFKANQNITRRKNTY